MVALVVLVLSLAPLAERHRVFVEDEAHFLLTEEERLQFVELETDELRDRFVDAFWRRFNHAEHLARLGECERLFGVRGRFGARGRVYQRLGAPSFRERLTRAGNRIVPAELWHYTGVDVPFLPDAFYLIFFQPEGVGEYRLWSPAMDGVAALMAAAEPGSFVLGADPRLEHIDPELALAVESLVPGGRERDALSLLASVEAFPELLERDRVFGEVVRVAVTTRELPVRLTSTVVVDDAGVSELHYTLDVAPGASESFHWRTHETRHRVRFTLVGRIVGGGGLALERERWEDAIELDVSAGEQESLATTRLSFRGRRLVRPDDARLELALITDGAGTIAHAPIDFTGAAAENDARATSERVRVLERTRTPGEEGRYRFARAVALALRGERERAIGELERAAALGTGDVRIHLELGRLLYQARRYREVLERLDTAATRFVGEVDIWVLMAGAAEALGRRDDATRYYDRALALAPEDAAIAAARERVR